MALHVEHITPTQRAAREARARLERKIAQHAHPDSSIVCGSASVRAAAAAITTLRRLVEPAPKPAVVELHYEPQPPLTIMLSVIDETPDADLDKLTIPIIQRAVARYYGLLVQQLSGSDRILAIVRPRQVAMFLARRLTNTSLVKIGARFGQRDHTTVLSAINRIENLTIRDPNLAADIHAICMGLAERFPIINW